MIAWARLGKISLDRDKAQIISLFSDSKTSDLLAKLDISQHVRSPSELCGDPLGRIKSIIKSGSPGAPVIVVGHTEGAFFRVEGRDSFTVPFELLTQVARNVGRPIFFIGCYTAEHFASTTGKPHSQDYSVGTLNLLHPREVVPRVLRSLDTSTSMRDFLEKLSDKNFEIWISSNFLRNVDGDSAKTVRAPIYKEMPDGTTSITGFIFMYIPCNTYGEC